MSGKALISLSGGLDSAVLLAYLKKNDESREIMALSFAYGSNHSYYELGAAAELSQHYGINRKVIPLGDVMQDLNSELLGGKVPEGHYNSASMKRTVVPGRNMIFISIMAAYAESNGFDSIYIGTHAGDHYIYPDCRPPFIVHVREAVWESSDKKVSLYAPFMNEHKKDLVKLGLELGVPFGMTRTCYKAQPIACGRCGSCQERLEAFQLNNVEDPIDYASRKLMTKTV